AELEVRLGGDGERQALRVRVRAAVGDERERCTSEPLHLEPRLHVAATGSDRARDRHRVREVAWTLPLVGAAHTVHAPDRLGVDADPGAEREPPAVDAADGDAPRVP